MSKTRTNRPTSEYICKPHKVPYLKSHFYEKICEFSGKPLGYADAGKKLRIHQKSARRKSKRIKYIDL